MYSETDIDVAVAAGAISADAAQALRSHVAGLRATPVADEENFRLLSGFNDIFVSIAAVLLLSALAWIGGTIHPALAGAFVAAAAWPLAEYFTRVRRMALPSIVLLLAFTGGVGAISLAMLTEHGEQWLGREPDDRLIAVIAAGIALSVAAAAWLHWRRFMVPITVAAGAGAVAATSIALIVSAIGPDNFNPDGVMGMVMAAGVGIFLIAMAWDRSDRERRTRRSDVAFWLHLLAAPMIAHSLFSLLGVSEAGVISLGTALLVIALYLIFGIVALAIDRRALLVSALAYVLYAMTQLFQQFGAIELNIALTGLVIGSALLLLSAFWQNGRRIVLNILPGALRNQVPAVAGVPQAA